MIVFCSSFDVVWTILDDLCYLFSSSFDGVLFNVDVAECVAWGLFRCQYAELRVADVAEYVILFSASSISGRFL